MSERGSGYNGYNEGGLNPMFYIGYALIAFVIIAGASSPSEPQIAEATKKAGLITPTITPIPTLTITAVATPSTPFVR